MDDSFGGYYAARIAAFERRYAAGVAFAALHWDLVGWQREVQRRHRSDPRTTTQSTFHFRWVMGCPDMDAAIDKARQFSLADVAARITCPFLVVYAEDDRVVPVESTRRLYEALGSTRASASASSPPPTAVPTTRRPTTDRSASTTSPTGSRRRWGAVGGRGRRTPGLDRRALRMDPRPARTPLRAGRSAGPAVRR